MNAQLYTLRDVTRLPTGGRAKFLRTQVFAVNDDEGGTGGVHAAVHAEILQRIIQVAMAAYRLTHP